MVTPIISHSARSSISPDSPPSSSLPFLNGATSRLTTRPLRKVWAAGLFGPPSSLTNPLPVKDGFHAVPDWVAYCFTALCTHSSLTQFPPDVSFTQAPSWIKALPDNVHDKTSRFWDLARLSFPDARREWLNSGQFIQQTPSPFLEVVEDPEQQMLCMDYLYYVGAITVRCFCWTGRFHPLTPPPIGRGIRIRLLPCMEIRRHAHALD